MWPDRYDKNSCFHLFHICHPTIERKMVLGTHLDCLQYHHKVAKTSRTILHPADDTVAENDVIVIEQPMRA